MTVFQFLQQQMEKIGWKLVFSCCPYSFLVFERLSLFQTDPTLPTFKPLLRFITYMTFIHSTFPNACHVLNGFYDSKATYIHHTPNIPNVPVASSFHTPAAAVVCFFFKLATRDPLALLFISIMSSFLPSTLKGGILFILRTRLLCYIYMNSPPPTYLAPSPTLTPHRRPSLMSPLYVVFLEQRQKKIIPHSIGHRR